MMNINKIMAIISILMLNYILTVLCTEGSGGLPPKRVESPSSLDKKKDRLGLLYHVGKIEVKKGIDNLLYGLYMPSSHPYSEYEPIIKKLRAEIASILRTPALEKSGIYYPESQIHFVNIQYNIEHLEKALMDISMFHNNAPIIENKYSCDLEFEVVEPNYIENSVNAVKVLIKAWT